MPDRTYNVFGGTLSRTQSINQSWCEQCAQTRIDREVTTEQIFLSQLLWNFSSRKIENYKIKQLLEHINNYNFFVKNKLLTAVTAI